MKICRYLRAVPKDNTLLHEHSNENLLFLSTFQELYLERSIFELDAISEYSVTWTEIDHADHVARAN